MSRATIFEIATLILALALFVMSQLVAPADEPVRAYEIGGE